MGKLATVVVDEDTLRDNVQLLKGKETAITGFHLGVIPRQRHHWRPGNTKGMGRGPDQSFGKGGAGSIVQKGLFNFRQLGCEPCTVAA